MVSFVRTVAFGLTLVFGTSAGAAPPDFDVWNTTISKVLLDSSDFGGCMALLGEGPASRGLTCTENGRPASNYVSMDCDGNYGTKSAAANLLSAAQLALVTGTVVTVRVSALKLYNDKYCVVERIDNSTTVPAP